MNPPLLIAGWSARAAVQSARRAGLTPTAVDTFVDADLVRDACAVRRIATPDDLIAAAAELPPGEWLYVGGVENYPDAVAAVGRRQRLLGVDPAALRRVRNPFLLRDAVVGGGFAFPATRRADEAASTAPRDGSWLVKRFQSAGGFGVASFDESSELDDGAYLQQRVDGVPYGATFVGNGRDARLLGVCRQLTSSADPQRPFRFAGAIGPIALPPRVAVTLQDLGSRLAAEFELVGLFGVDFVFDAAATVWTLEVNPRYTASVEVLERASGRALLAFHMAACRDGRLPEELGASSTELNGKQIVYAAAAGEIVVAESVTARLLADADVADVPPAGTRFRHGDPVATVFAAAATIDEVERQLAARARALLESLPSSA